MFKLSRRAGSSNWQVRKRWPQDVASILPGEFTASTGEGDKRRAAERVPMIAAAYLARVKEARDRLADNTQRDLSAPEVQRLAAEFYAKALPSYMLRRPAEDHAAVMRTTQERLADLKAMLGRHDFRPVLAIARTAVKDLPIPEDSPSLDALHRMLMLAFIELHRAALAHLQGETAYTPENIASPDPAAEAAPGRRVADLIDAYSKAKWEGWSRSVQIGIAPVFRLIRDALPDRDVSTVNEADAERILSLLKALPTNIGKRAALRGLSVPEAVEAGRRLGLPVIGPKTINTGYLVHIKAMFAWAVQRKWATENPFSGLSVADPVEDEDRRDPFKPADLKLLFGSAPWQPVNRNPGRKPSRFWVPLMALYTGARLAELAGLRLEDIEDRDGILVFSIRPHEGRSIKTKSSRRIVPVHTELLRIGFPAYVAERRKAGGPLLFPECAPNSRGQVGSKLSTWFTGVIRAHEITGRAMGMHSFRHGFEDRIREAGMEGTGAALRLTGRALSGSGRSYGDGNSTAELHRSMERITYPGLELSHLYAPTESL
ncbi:site-specific integrase [Polymorphobacter sp.]|uniref:site-specific integrase n=1 Tax=Polymorphobacter sp. TaxID=1909290 RepID=UPI003F6FDB41